MKVKFGLAAVSAVIICISFLFFQRSVYAHCDTFDGPVIKEAKIALEKQDVTPVLKWIKAENEEEVRTVFQKTLIVRTKGPEAQELADRYFFETLVRLHRASEGASYTGLKPAGTELEPSVIEADNALETGSADNLVKLITDSASAGIKERFIHTLEKKKHANESVQAGREFVAAYVEFLHYTERLYNDALGHAIHHED